ncbi:hypothetical protein [Mesorhizobium sp. M2A.F.Ca.ET.039.01.1.1]|uniref:hypothetical protein n=1 Tax=Mesorhizobium sp. M2A.F.Ca.ET.039.01.1.1 TaxID=2496746 RepID=UPI000FCC86E4|nr:hypothetical protein [Mesorhizobium sp. M2A.F.Ca.ET.039.01.1.1]RWX59880.1 hypothetical protein EOA24_34665 [Mesorhizobium sp. M2A.F.Ca.ET.039.01.1.1]
MSQFFATTELSLMRPLGSTAERSVHRMQAVLSREFPNGIGLELAEPVPRKDGAGIDWYTEREEPLVRMTALPQETADAYRARLRQAVDAVLRAAAAREARGDPASRSTVTALRYAVTYPAEENVWVSEGDGTLVLTAWGYESHSGKTSGGGTITAPTDRIPQPEGKVEEPPRSPAARPWGPLARALMWLVPIALAAAVAWLLLPACGVNLPFGVTAFGKGGGAYCALAAPLPEVDQASARTQELMAESAVLEEQLRRHLNSCQPAQPTAPPRDSAAVDADKLLKEKGITMTAGETAVTLTWDGPSDLDLYVTCPDGQVIPLGGNHCGGQHRLDMNISGDQPHSVENVTWGDQSPPPGHYEIGVRPYRLRENGGTDFTVILKRGQSEKTGRGHAAQESRTAIQKVLEFDVP